MRQSGQWCQSCVTRGHKTTFNLLRLAVKRLKYKKQPIREQLTGLGKISCPTQMFVKPRRLTASESKQLHHADESVAVGTLCGDQSKISFCLDPSGLLYILLFLITGSTCRIKHDLAFQLLTAGRLLWYHVTLTCISCSALMLMKLGHMRDF